MFDASFEVLNPKEVNSDSSSGTEDVNRRKIMASERGRVKTRGLRNQSFNLSDSSPEGDRFINDLSADQKGTPTELIPASKPRLDNVPLQKPDKETRQKHDSESLDNSDSDSIDFEEGDGANMARRHNSTVVIPVENAYDSQLYKNIQVPQEMADIFQHISRYTPQKIDIDYKLQPFIPDYIPAVGDIDAFIKVVTPTTGIKGQPLPDKTQKKIAELGLVVLDEPLAIQTDPALFHLKLRASSKSSASEKSMVVKKLENAEKNGKAIERWIRDVSDLHQAKPAPNVVYNRTMPDIDSLMEEWPENMETTLNNIGFPPASLDCDLSQYVDIICNLFGIPIHDQNDPNCRIQALHVLFTLFAAVKDSQLYAERQKDDK